MILVYKKDVKEGFRNTMKSEGDFEDRIGDLQRNPKEKGYFEWKKFHKRL